MGGWWNEVPLLEKIFWYFAIPFSTVFVIQLILTFIGMGDSDADTDGFDSVDIDDVDGVDDIDDVDIPDDNDSVASTFQFFTVRNFIAFFTVFGWTGITMSRAGAGPFVTVLVAVIAGVAIMFVVAFLFYFMMRLSESGNVKIQNAVGQTGKVYIPIPKEGKGYGKIHITFQGSYREMDAVTLDEELPTGTLVKVIDIMDNNVLVVEKTNKEGW